MSGPSAVPLQMVGDSGVVCVGDVCEVPAPSDQRVVIDLLDSGDI
ncbi:hypothetical protein B0I08_101371 [Glaciihabitans tibetensis]|uniref:Uncharacterized protein n=1 Tax=Glaciihabitans tibetensis TaxID=1266600 RepID=A0A2T0VJ50_9MICO|nr:hypothetical protein [Glaciihabitans tibetensis]PRY70243.1 hypothetical protein B0I08_101371 [Glaciihabitans tibetensis]